MAIALHGGAMSPKCRNRQKEPGFSLIELLVVVGIISVLLLTATPMIASYIRNYRVRAGAQQVLSELQAARAKAITKNAMLGVVLVILDNRSYRTVIEDGQTPPIVQTRPSIAAILADPACAGGGECPQAGPVRRLPERCQFVVAGGTFSGLRFTNLGQACEPGAPTTPPCPAIDAGMNVFLRDVKHADNGGGWMLTIGEITTPVTRDVIVNPNGRLYDKQ
jgi:prepilin-type N-terminal cleavage/methylation domain-containing protein